MMRITVVIIYLLLSFKMVASVSPNEFGLKNAKDGIERYWSLYRTHCEALKLGTDVDYSGIDNIQLTIPQDAKSIPLTKNTNFHGITITVENKAKDIRLFTMMGEMKEILVPQNRLDGTVFSDIGNWGDGVWLMILEDEIPWVKNRKGYNYGHKRRDVRLIIDGEAKNEAIMPYGNVKTTKPRCLLIKSDKSKKTIENIRIVRTKNSTRKTFCFYISGQNNLFMNNIKIETPWNTGMVGDAAIAVKECTNVRLENIDIDGSYSTKDTYGYCMVIDTSWNVSLKHVRADASWGVFYCSNLNKAYLEDCNVNRFDTHCYGKDYSFSHCYLHDLGMQISSVYGKILYTNCIFRNFEPVCLRLDYNSYVPFDLEIKDCTMHTGPERNRIAYMGRVTDEINNRPELKVKNWPNIKIDGLRIIPDDNTKSIYLYFVGGHVDENYPIQHLDNIDIKDLKIDGDAELYFCNQKVKTARDVKSKIQQARGYKPVKLEMDSEPVPILSKVIGKLGCKELFCERVVFSIPYVFLLFLSFLCGRVVSWNKKSWK